MNEIIYSSKQHTLNYVKYRTKHPPVLFNKIINYLKQGYTGPLDKALDVGCGSGQGTVPLTQHFKHVIAVDPSKQQIEIAKNNTTQSNIEYRVSKAESLPLPDASVELVTAGMAAHWFDLPQFYKECDRVLKPRGVLCIYAYIMPTVNYQDDPVKTSKLNKEIWKFYKEIVTVERFDPGRAAIDNEYQHFPLPFGNGELLTTEKADVLSCVKSTLDDYIGYVSTWSGYQAMIREDPTSAENEMQEFKTRLQLIMDSSNTDLIINYKYFLLMGRKP